ncbi:MAG: GNAT family N-acetyltransferase [bacterium]
MEYHSDRFDDYSLLIFKDDQLIALLPANKVKDDIYSHQGLTYGGLICHKKMRYADVLKSLEAILIYLHKDGVSKLYLKNIPAIYTSFPSDEIKHALHVLDAKLYRNDILSVVSPKNISLTKDRKAGVKRGLKNELEVREEKELSSFWNQILIPNLINKHQTSPVHSLEEIQNLRKTFPTKIRQFNVYHKNTIVAGTTIFETELVAHSQYISGDTNKNQLGSLDYLHHYLLTEVFQGKKYFDFGTSHEANGTKVNEGLMYWKEGFGARSISQEFYEISVSDLSKLKEVLV